MTGILRALETGAVHRCVFCLASFCAVFDAAAVGLGDVETAILKATYSDDLVPKAKHVVALVNISFEKPNHDFIVRPPRH